MRNLSAALFGAVLFLPVFLSLAAPAEAEGFTPAQRAEIVQILRDSLRQDPSILRDAVASMQAEEAAQQQATRRSAIAENQKALLGDPADPVAGDPAGAMTLVEFYDPRCPYCRNMLPVLAELLRRNPHLRLVYKDLPVLGPASAAQSRALLAAAKQGGYLKLQDVIMHAPSGAAADADGLRKAAKQAGLDPDKLIADMNDPAIQAHIEANLRLAQALQVEGTPALVIGDRMLAGAADLAELQQAVASAHR